MHSGRHNSFQSSPFVGADDGFIDVGCGLDEGFGLRRYGVIGPKPRYEPVMTGRYGHTLFGVVMVCLSPKRHSMFT